MPSLIKTILTSSVLLVAVSAQGVIISAKGDKGTSLPLQVQTDKADANIINTQELTTNVVNECGRTLLAGNIDIGEQTENQLANGTLTQVSKGGKLQVTIAQLSTDGAGPYTCDMDVQSNAAGITGQVPLNATEKDGGNGQIVLSMTMPKDLACVGASTGNVCTVRCFNTATAGPFGGCVAVQQSDVTPNKNAPGNINTAQTLSGVNAQVLQNQKDLTKAVAAIAAAPSAGAQGLAEADALLGKDTAAQATAGAAAAAATKAATTGNTGKKNGNKGAASAKGNGNAANAATAKGNGNGNKAAAAAAAGKNNNRARRFTA